MPSVTTTPRNLKPFVFHGLDLSYSDQSDEAKADCPFCGREAKFSVNIQTGQWRCFVCNSGTDSGKAVQGGNISTFLKLLWEHSDKSGSNDYSSLEADRKLILPDTLINWRVARSTITGEWLIPGYNAEGKVNQLYRYAQGYNSRFKLLATPELNHAIFGMNLYNPKKDTVYLCEGPWDAMALYEVLKSSKANPDGSPFKMTSNEDLSLLSDSNVLATPGANVFQPTWLKLFAGKRLIMLFDSDHPREHQGKVFEPVGHAGMKRIAQSMVRAEDQPREVYHASWGEKGYDPTLPSGWDLRDQLTQSDQMIDRVQTLYDFIKTTVKPIPSDWIQGRFNDSSGGSVSMDFIECTDWRALQMAWRKALKWTEGLDRALSCMLASVISTKTVGDQLWLKIMGPASCGKSTLCEALAVNKQYVFSKSTIRGFHSGYKTDRDGEEDNSLIPKVRDKTLVTKDGDTLLQSPNLSQILSEARDLYDCTSRTHYRHGVSRDYEGIRMTWLLCGTSSLRKLDSSELGERFLDCVIMESIDEDLEQEINTRVANRALRNVILEADGTPESHHDPDETRAMQMTAGYISYLRENAQELLKKVMILEESDALNKLVSYGTFVAYARARPSKTQDENAEREFSARLVSQHVRLAVCLAAVIGRTEIDEEVMRRVRRVALDTARGKTLEIIKTLYEAGLEGKFMTQIANAVNETEDKIKTLLRFLRQIKVADWYTTKTGGVTSRPKWRLTPRLNKLYREVVQNA